MGQFENKTIVITGATGLIGSNLVNRLLEYKTKKVIAIGRSKEKLETIFKDKEGCDNLVLLQHDISLPIEFNEPIDIVFHAASPIAGNIIRETPVDVIIPNIVGTLNILQEIEKHKETKLIIFSSATVYGNAQYKDIVVTEEDTAIADTLDAINAPYSESKRMTEVIAKAYAKQKGLDIKIVRFSYVYGFTKSVPNTAFYEFIKKAINGEDIVLNNANLPRRDNVYIDDAIDGLLCVAVKGESGQSYNISTNKEAENFAAVDEMAMVIAKVVNRIKGSAIVVKYKNATEIVERQPGIVLNNEKLQGLGWRVKTNIEEGIEQTIRRYLQLL